jgi:hypothetical protein
MLIGAHSVIYSTNADADRAFLRDVLKLPNVEAGGGYVIFGLPPAEVAVHPSDKNDAHELYLMCDDVEALIAEMKQRDIGCTPVQDEGWGLLTRVTLPGGGTLGIYQPRHARPAGMGPKLSKKVAKRATKRPIKRSGRKTRKKGRGR